MAQSAAPEFRVAATSMNRRSESGESAEKSSSAAKTEGRLLQHIANINGFQQLAKTARDH